MRRKLAAVIALTTTACTTWHVQSGPTTPEARVSGGIPGAVRLTLKGGATADVWDPRVVGDSIVAMNAPANDPIRQRIAFATADIESVATKKVSVGRTVLAVAAIAVAVVILTAGSSSSSSSSSSNSSCASARGVPSATYFA